MSDQMRAAPRPAEVVALEVLVNNAVDAHGADVIAWAWTNLFAAFLPLAAAMVREQRMFETAKRAGLTPSDVEQAITLIAALRAPPKDHDAWVAAEHIRNNATDVERLIVALRSTDPSKGTN